jgi:molybdate transport system substrate-binding protein
VNPIRRLFAALALLPVGCGAAAGGEPLTVAAASSLRDVLEHAARRFEETHPGTRVQLSFGASSTLARQIAAGARFDLFLAGDSASVERAGARIVPGSARRFLSNRLALVAAPETMRTPLEPRRLVDVGGAIAVSGPEVPAGRYTRSYLAQEGLLDDLEPRFVLGRNARATLALVEAGATPFGFVFASDQASSDSARLLWRSGAGDDLEIAYHAALVEGAHPMTAAFLDDLVGDAFRVAAEATGFVPVDGSR